MRTRAAHSKVRALLVHRHRTDGPVLRQAVNVLLVEIVRIGDRLKAEELPRCAGLGPGVLLLTRSASKGDGRGSTMDLVGDSFRTAHIHVEAKNRFETGKELS